MLNCSVCGGVEAHKIECPVERIYREEAEEEAACKLNRRYALEALEDSEVRDAIELLVIEKELNADVIREAAFVVDILESGDYD